jgi:hypothetical protein
MMRLLHKVVSTQVQCLRLGIVGLDSGPGACHSCRPSLATARHT